MLSKALDKYNDTVHSSTKMKPKDAHDDKNHMDVRVNLTRREKNTRKYPEVKVNDMVKVFEKKKDNYTERKEYNSKWSNQSYKIVKIEYDDVGNRTFKLEIWGTRFWKYKKISIILIYDRGSRKRDW